MNKIVKYLCGIASLLLFLLVVASCDKSEDWFNDSTDSNSATHKMQEDDAPDIGGVKEGGDDDDEADDEPDPNPNIKEGGDDDDEDDDEPAPGARMIGDFAGGYSTDISRSTN